MRPVGALLRVAALALLSLAACRPAPEPSARPAPANQPVSAPAPPAADAPAPPAPVARLKVPYSAIAGSTLVLPLARDAGLFARYGLDVEVISIPGSSVVLQSMLAGEIPISAVSSAAVVEADLAGADIPIIAGI